MHKRHSWWRSFVPVIWSVEGVSFSYDIVQLLVKSKGRGGFFFHEGQQILKEILLIKVCVSMDLIPYLARPQTVTGCLLDQWTGLATLERLYHPSGWLILPQSRSFIIKLYISVHTAFYRVQQQELLHGRMRIGDLRGGIHWVPREGHKRPPARHLCSSSPDPKIQCTSL